MHCLRVEFSYNTQPGADRLEHLRHEAEHERLANQLTRKPWGWLARLRRPLPRGFDPTNAEWAAAICYFQLYDAP